MVGVSQIELHIPAARSLKEKRSALRPLLDGARARYRVAIAEIEYQELHQRAVLEVAAVASSVRVVNEVLDAVERMAWSAAEAEVIGVRRIYLEDE